MADVPQIGEETKVTLDLKTIGMIVGFVISLSTVWFTLKADIALAMEMPKPPIDRVEYDLKDELIRQTIMDTQEDVDLLLEKFDKMEERIYELTKRNKMKYLLTVLLLLTTTTVLSQEWITDKDFEEKITAGSAFDDNEEDDVIVVEFWAEFNKDNAFQDWEKINNLEGVTYYRCDIATSPQLKKELRIRMAPTLLLYLKGDAYIKFTARAKLDLLCPVDYDKMVRAIEVVRREASY